MPTTRRPPSSSTSSASRLVLVVALPAAHSGCGEGDANARPACEVQATKAAEAAVVADYFAQGKLGTRAQVERAIGHPSLRFFDGTGRMLPYEQMTPAAQAVFNRWVANTRAGDITADARREARDAVEPDC